MNRSELVTLSPIKKPPCGRLIYEAWLRGKDLNLRPLGYEPNELPDCSTPHLYPNVPLSAGQSIVRISASSFPRDYNKGVPRFSLPAFLALALPLLAQTPPSFFP